MRYCVIPEGQKANHGRLARTGVSGSLVVETLHFAAGSIVDLADCFLRTKLRRWRICWRIKPYRRMRGVASDG